MTIKQKRAKEHIESRDMSYWRSERYPGYVYIVKCDDYIKVGIAQDFKSRLGSLQCGNPYQLQIVMAKKFKDYKFVEDLLQWTLEEHQHRNEWYCVSDRQLGLVVKTMNDLEELYESKAN